MVDGLAVTVAVSKLLGESLSEIDVSFVTSEITVSR